MLKLTSTMSKTETDSTSPANHNLSFHSCHLSRTENLPRLVHVSASANTRRVATFRISLHLSGSRGVSGAGSRAGTSSPQCQSGRIQRESCMDTEHRSWFPEILIQVKAFVFWHSTFLPDLSTHQEHNVRSEHSKGIGTNRSNGYSRLTQTGGVGLHGL